MERASLAAVLVVGLVLGSGMTAALGQFGTPGAPTDEAPSLQNATDADVSAGKGKRVTTTPTRSESTASGRDANETASLPTFESAAAFSAYVAGGSDRDVYYAGGAAAGGAGAGGDGGDGTTTETPRETARTRTPQATPAPEGTTAAAVEGDAAASEGPRVATTNVQVTGIDEPDIVKTDGRYFYYAPEQRHSGIIIEPDVEVRDDDVDVPEDEPTPTVDPPEPPERGDSHRTYVVDTQEPASPELVSEINASGRLLRVGSSLVVLGEERIARYDVSDPDDPTKTWSTALNGSLVTARVANGTLYLVTESRVGYGDTCPIRPLGNTEVACTDIHHPPEQIRADAVYTAIALDPASGNVQDATSFVGTSENTVVYMSGDALYVTYTKESDRADLIIEFLFNESERLPAGVRERLREIRSYDISAQSKLRETVRTLERWQSSLPEKRQREVLEEIGDEYRDWRAEHRREFTTTGIVRVGVDDFAVEAVGSVPGKPLNQFSLSQHEGTLRIATTIPRTGGTESANDLYVLNATTLKRIGAKQGMGEGQRVYAVRYVGDTAYVVTYRQVDPLHVVDLSNPANPTEAGTLQLPGFSSYLHPVDEDHVLGIGKQDGEVKAVLFDVSDPANPKIDDTLLLEQDWSAISETHHAFMQDRRHGVFFLPAGEKALIVDYTNSSLDVETRVRTAAPPSRARYVGNYLYVFAGDTIEVLDERTWKRVMTLRL